MRRVIWNPTNKRDLVSRALARLELILDIEDRVSTADALLAAAVFGLGLQQFLTERGPVTVIGGFLDDDLLPVVANSICADHDPLAGCTYALRRREGSAGSLQMMYFMLLPSFSSLKAVMHSGATETLFWEVSGRILVVRWPGRRAIVLKHTLIEPWKVC